MKKIFQEPVVEQPGLAAKRNEPLGKGNFALVQLRYFSKRCFHCKKDVARARNAASHPAFVIFLGNELIRRFDSSVFNDLGRYQRNAFGNFCWCLTTIINDGLDTIFQRERPPFRAFGWGSCRFTWLLKHDFLALDYFPEFIRDAVDVHHIHLEGQVRIRERFAQSAKLGLRQPRGSHESEVEVGRVFGRPLRTRTKSPDFAFRHFRLKNGAHRGELVRPQINHDAFLAR